MNFNSRAVCPRRSIFWKGLSVGSLVLKGSKVEFKFRDDHQLSNADVFPSLVSLIMDTHLWSMCLRGQCADLFLTLVVASHLRGYADRPLDPGCLLTSSASGLGFRC